MPRSGSTLVEQILSSHPDTFGAGETTSAQRVIDLLRNLNQHLLLLDGDGDGHITRDEFCDGFSILDAGRDDYGYVDLFAAFDLDSDGQSSRQQWHLTFDVVDTNHDGRLSAEEFYAVACTDDDD